MSAAFKLMMRGETMEQANDRLTPDHAAVEIDRMSRRVSAGGRWQGWMWLLIGLATFAFFVGTGSGSSVVVDVVGLAFPVLGIAVGVYASRQHVVDRLGGRIERSVTSAYVTTVTLGVVVKLTVIPSDRVTAGLVIVGAITALPALAGAWRVLRAG